MSISRRRFISITAGLALSASISPAIASPAVWRGIALGAEAKLAINGLPEDEAQRLIALAIAEIERLEGLFSIYRNASALMRLNENGLLRAPPPELLALLSHVDVVYRATGGLFDPTIQPVWMAYGKHKGKPPLEVLEGSLSRIGWRHVRYDSNSVAFEKPGMALTLNGIAQGFVTDRIVSLLRSQGLRNAVVNIGEISALGNKSAGEPWRIGIAEYGDEDAEEYVALTNQAIATSSPNGTTFDGTTSHIVNPLTGRPTSSQWQRVSVVHDLATIADGLSTAMVMMSSENMQLAASKIDGATVIAKPKIDEFPEQ